MIDVQVAGLLRIKTDSKTGKRYPILETNNGDLLRLTQKQADLLWYLIGHDFIKEGQHITLGTDGDN